MTHEFDGKKYEKASAHQKSGGANSESRVWENRMHGLMRESWS